MDLSPMLATLAEAPLQSKLLVYEPKYDGIRAIVEIVPGRKGQARAVRARAERRMGGSDRQGGVFHLPAGAADAGVAQDQAAAGAGVRHRLLDRTAPDAAALPRAAARRLRERHAALRRSHRHR